MFRPLRDLARGSPTSLDDADASPPPAKSLGIMQLQEA